MSVQIVLHKGFQGICYENSLVGVLLAIFKKKFCEIDLLYVDGEWKMCHDFDCLNVYNTKLSTLLEILKQYQDRVRKPIIFDLKWDFIKNQQDILSHAMNKLKTLFVGMEEMPFWFQAPNIQVLEQLKDQHFYGKWKLGMIIYDMEQFHKHKNTILSYVMVSLPDFTQKDIRTMSFFCPVFGYTCKNMHELSKYAHLFKYLNGVVCDLYV